MNLIIVFLDAIMIIINHKKKQILSRDIVSISLRGAL